MRMLDATSFEVAYRDADAKKARNTVQEVEGHLT